MIIIPAIDIKNRNCVRLVQGKEDKETIYSNDPVLMAKRWEELGAKRIHIVDLDGAFKGKSHNFEIIKSIREKVDIVVEVGGGMRSLQSVKNMIDIGIDKVIIGTASISNPELVKTLCMDYEDKIIVGVDAYNGRVATKGWKQIEDIGAISLINKMHSFGVKEFIYTDISKDGMLEGPSLESVKEVCESTAASIIVSGGISSIEDIENVKNLNKDNISGIIIGKALYDNKIKLEDAIHVVK